MPRGKIFVWDCIYGLTSVSETRLRHFMHTLPKYLSPWRGISLCCYPILTPTLTLPTAGSRSGSPSSRLSYATYNSPHHHLPPHQAGTTGTLGRTRRRSGIPRSTGTSREPSPNRAGYPGSSYVQSPTGGLGTPKGRTRSISGECVYHGECTVTYMTG